MPLAWPRTGTIEFREYGLQYRKGLDWALKEITLLIKEREKVNTAVTTLVLKLKSPWIYIMSRLWS